MIAETFYCGVQTRAMRYVDPEPSEHCEEEVVNEGDLCARHDEDDEPDYDSIREERYLEERGY